MAGGRSSRFGADKCAATWTGKPLIAHSVAALRPQVDKVVICGRVWDGLVGLDDRPGPGLGPLGAISAALNYAAAQGFAAVISVPVDVHPLPNGLRDLLEGEGPAVLVRQTAIGWWPADLARPLDAHIAVGDRSLESWISATGARRVNDAALRLVNVNRPEDLDTLEGRVPTETETRPLQR